MNMNNRRNFLSQMSVGVAMLSRLVNTSATETSAPKPPSKTQRQVTLGVTDLTFHRVTAAAVAHVIERMNVKVTRQYALHEANFERLHAGEVDMLASAWLPYSHGIYKERVEKNVPTQELGLHYTPYAMWGVTQHVPAGVVDSVEDLLKPEVLSQMTRLIQGIGPGAGITRFSQNMMEQYGLNEAGYQFRTGTQQECFDAFEKAVSEGRWAVVPLWHPQFLHNKYAIRELKDPKGLLGGTDRAVLLARRDRLESMFTRDEIQILDSIRLSNAAVSQMDYFLNREGMNEDEAFAAWLRQPDSLFFRDNLLRQGIRLT